MPPERMFKIVFAGDSVIDFSVFLSFHSIKIIIPEWN